MSQIAKMFLRGSLVKTTAKNLTKEQKIEVEQLMKVVWNDPKLDNAKHEFCQALGRTIGGEYCNKEFAMQEVWITLWRTAVDVLYHNPKAKVAENAIIRKKHFQTCIFNYLRQILTENKIPKITEKREISGPANYVAKEIIETILINSNSKLDYDYNKESNTFSLETGLIPHADIKKIWKLATELKDVTTIEIEDEYIAIISNKNEKYFTKKIKEKVRIKQNSLNTSNSDDDADSNGFQQYCEYQSVKKRARDVDQMAVNDTIEVLRDRLPKQTQLVFDILINQPQDFVEEFYPRRKTTVRPKEIHIAKWLGMSKEDVIDHMSMIKEQAIALDIGQ